MVSYGLSYGWQAALVRWLLLKELGPLAASEVDPGPGLTSALLNDTPLGPARPVSVWQEAATLLDLNGGSNAWVIAPERTAGGAAQLAGDPHLPLEWPCFWYVARLQAPLSEAEQALWVALMEKALASGGKAPAILPWEPPERLDAAGGTIPAIPVVLAGRNQQVAWSPTAAMTDVQDLFIERLEGWPEPRYRTENGWENARVEYHEIEVRGREPAPSSTVITRNGPLVARLGRDGSVHMWDEAGTPPLGSWRGLAMRWLGTDNSLSPPVDAVGMAACLQLAVSPGEVQAVTGAWRDPCKRVAFACRSGEVGVAMAGQLPHRRRGDGGLPYPGWQAASRWAGVLRLADAELPEESQNADGIVVAANETVPGVAGNYHPAFRARRIQNVLDGLEEITVAHHARLQVDRESGLGLRFVARLRERPPGTSGPTERRALGELMTWDGRLESNAPGAAVFQFVFHELLSLLSQERLGPQLAAYYLGKGFSPISRSTTWRTRAPAAILKLWLPEGRRWYWQDRLERAFRSGVERLVAAQGERPENWRWGDVRTVEPFHVMARENPWLRRLFDVPSVKLEGGIDTVAPGGFSYHRFPEGTGSLGVYRQVIDWAQPDRFWFALAGGQGAHPGSPHHVDLLPAWQEGRLTPLWMGQDPAPEEFGPHRTLVLERD